MKYTMVEFLASDLYKTFNDWEVGFTGLVTGDAASMYASRIPLAAMELARRTHSPNLTILLNGWLLNPEWNKLDTIPTSEIDELFATVSSECFMTDYPTCYNHRKGDISFGFASGAQVDKEGNVNSTLIGDYKKPTKQLVGPIFLPEHFSLFGREYIMMPYHEKRNFVEHVDYISGVGFPGGKENREKFDMMGSGPAYIYTPKCIFAFDEDKKIYVKSIHPSVTKQDVIDSTGFDVGDLSDTPTTPEPTEEELRILREEVDPKDLILGITLKK